LRIKKGKKFERFKQRMVKKYTKLKKNLLIKMGRKKKE